MRAAVLAICEDARFRDGEVSIAIVGEREMQELHQRFLGDASPTDVLAFPLQASGALLEGEIVVCGDVARQSAPDYGWRTEDELLLYVVHGALHLVGYDDTSQQAFFRMREAEKKYLSGFGLSLVGRDQSAHPEEQGP
jgi:probable rRNA maturation factor